MKIEIIKKYKRLFEIIFIILMILIIIVFNNNMDNKENHDKYSNNTPTSKNVDFDLEKYFGFTSIPSNLIPTWIPDNFKLEDVASVETEDMKLVNYIFHGNDEKERISFYIFYLYNEIKIDYEKDDSPVEKIEKDGITYYIMGNLDSNTFIWKNGPFECQVAGTVSRDVLKQMIDSIPTK